MSNWTQPVCEARYQMLYPGREPVRIVAERVLEAQDELDKCCFCGMPTTIYIRIDPATVPYPRGRTGSH